MNHNISSVNQFTQDTPTSQGRKSWFALLCLILISVSVLFFRLGDRPLRNPDEGRYAEVAREMVLSGNWLEPTLYGTDYLRKPILFYWLISSSYLLFGINEWSARLVPALFGFFGVLLTYAFARKHLGHKSAMCAGLILATNPFYTQICRYLLIDSVFAFFLISAFYLAYGALRQRCQKSTLLFYGALALAFLAKGVAALVIPVAGILMYLLLSRLPKRDILNLWSWKGVLIFLGLALPWYVAISLSEPEFFQFFFVHEHMTRYLSSQFEHQEPWYFYLAFLPVIFLPWSILIGYLRPGRAHHAGPFKEIHLYLISVIAGVVLFYTLSKSKLITYLLPIIPLGCVLLGSLWHHWMTETSEVRTAGISLLKRVASIIGALVVAAACFVLVSPVLGLSFPAKIPESIRLWVFLALGLTALTGFLCFVILARDKRRTVWAVLVIFLSAASFLIAPIMEAVNHPYNTRDFARTLKPLLKEEDTVFIYHHPGAFYDFAFYLNRPVKLVGLEGELEFNQKDFEQGEHEDAVLTYEQWAQLVRTEKIYGLMRKSDYQELDDAIRQCLHVIDSDKRKVLVESRPARKIK